MRTSKKTLLLSMTLATALACSESGEEPFSGDDVTASFGGSDSKADGIYSACQLSEALALVNRSDMDVAAFGSIYVRRNAAAAVLAHRDGPDRTLGTADDNLFDDLDELDSVPYVGPVTLRRVVEAIQGKCDLDLNSRPFIDADTFSGSTGGGWTRDNIELEAAMTVDGITGARLRSIMTSTDERERTIFSRIRRSKLMGAFSYGYAIDEIPWGRTYHEARESMPHVSLTIESGRFEPEEGGPRELSLGTDIMDDVYYDTRDYALMSSQMSVRGRIRWDTDNSVRRLLIAAKMDGIVDENGLKRAAKVDVRTEGGRHVPTLDRDVRRGTVEWSGSLVAIAPIASVYERLAEMAILPDIDGHKDVLLLDPKAHIRSTRSRFHFNQAPRTALQSFHRNGLERIRETLALVQEKIAAGGLAADDLVDAEALLALGQGILDGSALKTAAADALSNLGKTADDFIAVADYATPQGLIELEVQKASALATDRVFHEFADQLDDLDRALTATRRLPYDEYVDMYVEWQRVATPNLSAKTVIRPFLTVYSTSDRAVAMTAFRDFGSEAQRIGSDDFAGFEDVNDEIWDALGPHLEFEMLKIIQRQIEGAGTISHAIWFDMARAFYVPNSSRSGFSNFMIDTMDFTQMISHDEWLAIPESRRLPTVDLPASRVFHAKLVNEVQIELGSEKPYVERIQTLQDEIAASGQPEELQKMLDGTKFVFETYQAALAHLADIKGEAVIDRLEEEGAPRSISWVPATHSKGKTALLILADQD
jgi:hypothetical protein